MTATPSFLGPPPKPKTIFFISELCCKKKLAMEKMPKCHLKKNATVPKSAKFLADFGSKKRTAQRFEAHPNLQPAGVVVEHYRAAQTAGRSLKRGGDTLKPPYPANSRSNVLGNRAHLAQHWTFSWVKRWKIEVEIDVPSRDRFQVQQRGIACGNNFLDRHKHHVKTAVPNGNVAVGGDTSANVHRHSTPMDLCTSG